MPEGLNFAPPVITVDVEDWPQSTWDRSLPITERAVSNTRKVLELLRKAQVRATMFVLGKLAETFPYIVREIQADGHEVASHGYGHLEIFKQSRREFHEDALHSKDLLEQILGESVRGYRAPDFSVVQRSLWALELLSEIGYTYDSSIFPVSRRRYGIPEWPVTPAHVALPNGKSIIEIPIATFRCFDKNWPVGGGGYHRLLPGGLSRWLAERVMGSQPFTFYCHPYEFDGREFEELSIEVPLSTRLHQGLGRSYFAKRFSAFLLRFGGRRVEDLLLSSEFPTIRLNPTLDSVTPWLVTTDTVGTAP